jgi:hypothetical protein
MKVKFGTRQSKSTWLQALHIITNDVVDIASAALVFNHEPPFQREGSPSCIAKHICLAPSLDYGASSVQVSSEVEQVHESKIPVPAPPGPSRVPLKCRTTASTSIIDPESAIAAGSPSLPLAAPAQQPAQQRGALAALPMLVRRAKASSTPSALPTGPAAPALQTQGRDGKPDS